MAEGSTLIVVFAKAPQPGRVKTRLAATLGGEAAARLHGRLLERAIATALAAGCGPVELHGSPARHGYLRRLARRHGIRLVSQPEGDVGTRMHAAFRRGLRRHARMILIGSDCPALAPADLRRAGRLLRGCDAVIAPAEDGGYPLIGLKRASAAVFEGVAWSTGAVMPQTRERLAGLGWRWRELRTLWDVDRPADLARLRGSGLLGRPV
ncbi:MAG: TIGR04282 family arsenosugar biosynthesis glycosyltransferase [Proteobacteria bacterium]|nr:TIGR04282 family arsenosugar biosynthesis glycosyltransferase [Pseudomonadota bacterium]